MQRQFAHLGARDDDAGGIAALIEFRFDAQAAVVRVWPMSATTVSKVRSGRPRQFCVMWQNSRCSILFHLLVPGGKCET